jgi:hypothetical protein
VEATGPLDQLIDHALLESTKYDLTEVHLKAIFGLAAWLTRKLKKPHRAVSRWLKDDRQVRLRSGTRHNAKRQALHPGLHQDHRIARGRVPGVRQGPRKPETVASDRRENRAKGERVRHPTPEIADVCPPTRDASTKMLGQLLATATRAVSGNSIQKLNDHQWPAMCSVSLASDSRDKLSTISS